MQYSKTVAGEITGCDDDENYNKGRFVLLLLLITPKRRKTAMKTLFAAENKI